MEAFEIALSSVLMMLLLIYLGMHIAVTLALMSFVGAWIITGNVTIAFNLLQIAATNTVNDFVFAVIPLFMLMGEFIGKSGTVTDVYRGINRLLRKIPGRLAIATVVGNALFSFVTGVSIASAAAFSRIAYPEMKRYGYHKGFALGAVALFLRALEIGIALRRLEPRDHLAQHLGLVDQARDQVSYSRYTEIVGQLFRAALE